MVELLPAIIPLDAEAIESKVQEVSNKTTTLHIDVLPMTFEPERLSVEMDFEAHLMFLHSSALIDKWLAARAKRIIVHVEDFEGEELGEILSQIRVRAEVGLAVKLDTDLERVYPYVSKVDCVQLMSIAEIGEQGHPFDERIFDRIKQVKAISPQTIISIDGGVGKENAEQLIESGAERLVVGHNFIDVWSQMNSSKS